MLPLILLTSGSFRSPVPEGSSAEGGTTALPPAARAAKKLLERASLKIEYVHSVEHAGGAPVLLANSTEHACTRAAVARAGGLVLTGGWDVAPELYGQEPQPTVKDVDPVRDATEQAALQEAMRRGIPVLAICRGLQMLNVALGGTLVQDIPSFHQGGREPARARPMPANGHKGEDHPVRVEDGSILADIWGKLERTVNSRHHQAADELGAALRATAWAPDGIIEAVESINGYPLLGLQCHPEDLSTADPDFHAPFQWLVQQAKERRG